MVRNRLKMVQYASICLSMNGIEAAWSFGPVQVLYVHSKASLTKNLDAELALKKAGCLPATAVKCSSYFEPALEGSRNIPRH
jgi:hypothetical protein